MNNKTRRGYTLLEAILAIVIAGVIYTVFSVVINTGLDAWIFLRGQRSIMAETRATMKRMVREIRRTGGSGNIVTFTATQLRFVDIDGNNINYQQNGTALERNDMVILPNLDSLEFRYFNSGEAETDNLADIRTVQITLRVKEGDNLVRLRSAAGIRNR